MQPIKRRFDKLWGNARGLELKKGEKATCRKFILNSNFYLKALKITQI